jgi:hypothetical protein
MHALREREKVFLLKKWINILCKGVVKIRAIGKNLRISFQNREVDLFWL